MRLTRVLAVLVAVVLVGAIGFVALGWRASIAMIDPPAPESFDPELVKQGSDLAAIGNCNVCHTRAGGEVLAGGRAMPTPFGTIYSTNITPDPETGIGRWSEAAFQRSMHEGVDREGRHLYPAFPYDHFTLTSDEDNRALYAFLMTRQAVRAETPENDLPFPLNIRMTLAGWKLLFFREGRHVADAGRDATWSRGQYLAEGLGHCGACHTPRNALGAEKRDEHFAGGETEGWTAYALNENSPAPVPWTVESMAFYLKNGWDHAHGVARGPMAPVTANLGVVSDEDIRAMAV
jgi:mono/diheme cytochrome c family protein